MSRPPDVFTPVHKGLRKALFDLCLQLGRADASSPAVFEAGRKHAADVIRFVDHHTIAEDTLLLPLLQQRAPVYFERLTQSHRGLEAARLGFVAALDADAPTLYRHACTFTAAHLEHMHEEEHVHLPVIHIHVTTEELHDFERQASVLAPLEDRQAMVRHMVEALNGAELDELFSKLAQVIPEGALRELQALAGRARGGA